MIEEFAPAKINLTLCVRGRRADGYHDLESLVAFADLGDRLTFEPGGRQFTLEISGPYAGKAGAAEDNLVLKAARRLAMLADNVVAGAFRLHKQLPVAAGLGGGSSDAAAALRVVARASGLAVTHPALWQAARETGADVSVCLETRPRLMRGIGHNLGPPLALPALWLVLANPGVMTPTAMVFSALGLTPGQDHGGPDPACGIETGLETRGLLDLIKRSRNDLEPAAVLVAPEIKEALALVSALEGCQCARMSGSGATVFGVFEAKEAAMAAAERLSEARPQWWVKTCALLR